MSSSSIVRSCLCATAVLLATTVAWASPPAAAPASVSSSTPATGSAAPAASGSSAPFSAEAATEAYLARLSPAARARSDAYFEGGYWIQLWDFVYLLAVAWLLLASGLSVRLRDLCERMAGAAFLGNLLYGAGYAALTFLFTLPLTIYSDYFREHLYGLANQSFGPWMGEQLIGAGITVAVGAVAVASLYAVLRRAPGAWWIWASALGVVFLIVAVLVSPVWIEPLFNRITPLQNAAVADPILRLARASGIPAEHVYVADASKQSKRVSAHVTGLFGTLRIELNDNLLHRASPRTIQAVMGHEMGHYVLHHLPKTILSFSLLLALGLACLSRIYPAALTRFGPRYGLRGLADTAGLPLLAALFAAYLFVLTPVANTLIRTDEAEADLFGLNAARQPDGHAEAALLLSEYRKLRPGPIEEWVFFDHPSGYHRILMAMRWKQEHLADCDLAAMAGDAMPAALPGSTVATVGAPAP